MNRYTHPFTAKDDALLRRLRRSGVRPQAMLPRFPDRTYKSLHNRLIRLGLTGDGMPRGPRRTRMGQADWMRGADDLGPFPNDDLSWCESEWEVLMSGRQFVDHGMVGA